MKKIFVLDTNVLLYSAQALEAFEDNIVVIPMTVIEELDKFKRDQDELGRNARHVIRRLDELRSRGRLSEGVPLDDSADPEKSGMVRIVVSEGKLTSMADMGIADNRILNVAKMLRDEGKYPVRFITKDLNLRLKADALDIEVEDYDTERIEYDDLYSGVQELEIDSAALQTLGKEKNIPLPEGVLVYPNQFLILKDAADPSHSLLGWCRHDRIETLPDGVTDRVWNISPRSKEQRMALQLLMDPEVQVVSLVGQAGSGKTLLALAAALQQVAKGDLYDKILVSRPIVPMGRDIGYLPGGKDEKLTQWMQPIYDNLGFLLRSGKVDTPQQIRRQIDELKRSGKLEIEALTYIRGRSIPRQFVIVDEAQNLTPHEIKTIVSRSGEGTKMVLTGDPSQIDSPYLDATTNGLTYLAERFKPLALHGHITLRKSERSALAAAAAECL